MWGVAFYDPSQSHFQHLSLKFAYNPQFKMRWQRSVYQPASPLFIRHQDLARAIFTWQGTTWEWHFLARENLWQVTSVAAEPCDVSDFHPSKFRPSGSSSWKSVWVRSPLSWRDTDSLSGAGGVLAMGGRGSREMGSRELFHFCILIGKHDRCMSKYMWFSWIFLVSSWSFLCLLPECIPLSHKVPKTAVS